LADEGGLAEGFEDLVAVVEARQSGDAAKLVELGGREEGHVAGHEAAQSSA
jgi:hypothetical protein